MTYDEFDKAYGDCIDDFISDLNNKLGTRLVYRDFDDYFYKMESIVISEVDIKDED